MATADPLAELETIRQVILTLARYQRDLRTRLGAALKPSGKSPIDLGTFGHALERRAADGKRIGWSELNRFLNEGTTLTSARILRPLVAQLGLPETGLTEILAALKGLSDRQSSMAGLSDAAINLACAIRAAYLKSKDCSEVAFVSLFTPYETVAANCVGPLWGSRSALVPLDQEEIQTAIETMLTDPHLTDRIQAAIRAEAEQRKKLADELAPLITQIRPDFDSLEAVAQALGFSYSTLRYAVQGKAGLETHQKLLAAARAYQAAKAKKPPKPPGSAGQTKPQPPARRREKTSLEPARLAVDVWALAGHTTPDGVAAVLGPADFKQLKLELDEATIQWMADVYAAVRVVNNLISQAQPEQRELYKARLEGDFMEALMSFQLLRSAAPQVMIDALNGMRQTWASER